MPGKPVHRLSRSPSLIRLGKAIGIVEKMGEARRVEAAKAALRKRVGEANVERARIRAELDKATKELLKTWSEICDNPEEHMIGAREPQPKPGKAGPVEIIIDYPDMKRYERRFQDTPLTRRLGETQKEVNELKEQYNQIGGLIERAEIKLYIEKAKKLLKKM